MIQPNFHFRSFGLRDTGSTKPMIKNSSEGDPTIVRTMVMECPSCGSADSRRQPFATASTSGNWPVVTCNQCELMYASPRPRDDQWDKVYPVDYRPHQSGSKKSKARDESGLKTLRDRLRQQTIQRWHPVMLEEPITKPTWKTTARDTMIDPYVLPVFNEARLLDFGCGSGQFLARMSKLGWKVWGIDMGKQAVQRARLIHGLNVSHGTLPGTELPQKKFEVITAWQVLEHLTDPIKTLWVLGQHLARDGRLVLTVPNQGGWAAQFFGPYWISWDLPRHLLHFTAQTLPVMLEKAGLEVLSISTVGHASWIRHSARRAAENGEKKLARWKSQGRSRRSSQWAVLNGQGESLMAVARKK